MASKKSIIPLLARRSKQTPGRASKVLPFPQRVKVWQAGLSTLSIVLLGFIVWGLAMASSSPRIITSNANSPTVVPSLKYDVLRGRYKINLAWSGSTYANRYVILRNNEFYGSIQTTTFQDYNITPGVTYVYQVRALNSVEDVQAQSTAYEVTVTCTWLVCHLD